MPSTILGDAPGASRTVPTWQVAQFRPTRPPLSVVPIGRGRPLPSLTKPRRSYPVPGRFGSLSSKTIGSTRHSADGMPTVGSVPIDPYLK